MIEDDLGADLPPAQNRLLWLAAVLPVQVAVWGSRIVSWVIGLVGGFGAVVVGLFVLFTLFWFVIALFAPAFAGAFEGMLSVTVPLVIGAGKLALVLGGIIVATGALSGLRLRVQHGVHEGRPVACVGNVGLYGLAAAGMFVFTRGFARDNAQYQGDPGYIVTIAGLYGVVGAFILLTVVTIVGTAIEQDDWPL